MLRVILCDDERLARQRLRQLLADHPNLQIVGESDSRRSTLTLLKREKPDALFLDIEMPGGSGFDLLRGLSHPPQVVMVTAYAQHAARAFEIEAVDYLVKPVSAKRFAQAVHRLENACAKKSRKSHPSYSLDDQICFRSPQQTVVVPARSVILLKADGDFTRVHVAESAPLMICHPLRFYEKNLPSPPFVRLDRSYVVNLHSIVRMNRKSRDSGQLVLQGIKETVPLGRAAQLRLKEYLPKNKSNQ